MRKEIDVCLNTISDAKTSGLSVTVFFIRGYRAQIRGLVVNISDKFIEILSPSKKHPGSSEYKIIPMTSVQHIDSNCYKDNKPKGAK